MDLWETGAELEENPKFGLFSLSVANILKMARARPYIHKYSLFKSDFVINT